MGRSGQARREDKVLRRLAILAALLPQAIAAQPAPRAGEVYEIERVSESRFSTNGAGEGNAYDRDTLIERVIAVREDGVELEYDLPSNATAEDRLREWQFPFRVLKPARGPIRLLNGPELEARVDRWLTAANWTRAQCGHWYFTWNAFQVQCDPASVLDIVTAFDLTGQELREGALTRTRLAPPRRPCGARRRVARPSLQRSRSTSRN